MPSGRDWANTLHLTGDLFWVLWWLWWRKYIFISNLKTKNELVGKKMFRQILAEFLRSWYVHSRQLCTRKISHQYDNIAVGNLLPHWKYNGRYAQIPHWPKRESCRLQTRPPKARRQEEGNEPFYSNRKYLISSAINFTSRSPANLTNPWGKNKP